MNIVKKSGAAVTVHSVNQDCYEDFRQAGANTATHTDELRDSDVLFLCLPNGEV